MPIARLAPLVQKHRGERGLRETAAEIGISPATLSRVERGKLPDIETFSRLCSWLKVDPADILEIPRTEAPRRAGRPDKPSVQAPAVHLRAKSALSEQTAKDLAQLILAAQDEMTRRGLR
jgi:DNA-binding Xre family transcriptional regulator